MPAAKAARRTGATPLDLTAAEDAQLLSAKEFELCSTLRILPKAYLTMKEMMIQENNQQVRWADLSVPSVPVMMAHVSRTCGRGLGGGQGYLKRAQARRMIRMDVNKTGKVYDYFVAVGWVRPGPVNPVDGASADNP